MNLRPEMLQSIYRALDIAGKLNMNKAEVCLHLSTVAFGIFEEQQDGDEIVKAVNFGHMCSHVAIEIGALRAQQVK